MRASALGSFRDLHSGLGAIRSPLSFVEELEIPLLDENSYACPSVMGRWTVKGRLMNHLHVGARGRARTRTAAGRLPR